MTETLYLSRIRLKRDASVQALLPVLLGHVGIKDGRSRHTGHHLIWSLFAGEPERQRDFLWREMDAQGTFLILSARPPVDRNALFEIDEPKPFAPALATGDRLRFSLRANPVIRRRSPSRNRSVKHDVVMDALRNHPSGLRAECRLDAVREAGSAWLARQAGKAGFTAQSEEIGIDGYQQHRVERKGSARAMSFSTLDFDGILEVREPAVFLSCVARGFGAAKAYGCGLMLIRRA